MMINENVIIPSWLWYIFICHDLKKLAIRFGKKSDLMYAYLIF